MYSHMLSNVTEKISLPELTQGELQLHDSSESNNETQFKSAVAKKVFHTPIKDLTL